MKKTATLAELLTENGFTAEQHNETETLKFYTRTFEKEVEVAWHGTMKSTLTVSIAIQPDAGWCRATFYKDGRAPYKSKEYGIGTTTRRTFNAIAATIQNAGFEI